MINPRRKGKKLRGKKGKSTLGWVTVLKGKAGSKQELAGEQKEQAFTENENNLGGEEGSPTGER